MIEANLLNCYNEIGRRSSNNEGDRIADIVVA